MSVNPITPNITQLFISDPVSSAASELKGSRDSFANVLTEAFNTASQTDAADKGSALQMLMGESDDLSGLLIDAQKAELSLQLALQIRNKVIDAYNEVMRMSV